MTVVPPSAGGKTPRAAASRMSRKLSIAVLPGSHLESPPAGRPTLADMIENGTGLFTIGQLARGSGLSVRTIRYWSDEGVLHPVTRSAGGYRLYDAESVARLELIRTLRELGLGLDHVRRVLAGRRPSRRWRPPMWPRWTRRSGP